MGSERDGGNYPALLLHTVMQTKAHRGGNGGRRPARGSFSGPLPYFVRSCVQDRSGSLAGEDFVQVPACNTQIFIHPAGFSLMATRDSHRSAHFDV